MNLLAQSEVMKNAYMSFNGDRYFNLGYAYASDNQPVKALEMFAKAKVPALLGL